MKTWILDPSRLLYEGKAKQVFATDEENQVIIHYKDDASAYNGIKRAQIDNKGIYNNQISSILYQKLEERGIATHFVQQIDQRNQLCQKARIIPLEVIVRNYAAGTMAKRLKLKEGLKFETPVFEYCYKNDELGDPLVNEHHAVALGLSTYEELEKIHQITIQVNQELQKLFQAIGITLIDFKIEFGYLDNHTLVLADELSPDTCRLWDSQTLECLDKDRFRRDLGRVGEAYQEILTRLSHPTIPE